MISNSPGMTPVSGYGSESKTEGRLVLTLRGCTRVILETQRGVSFLHLIHVDGLIRRALANTSCNTD